MLNRKFLKEFRKAHPETIGERDSMFDLDNYTDFIESQLTQSQERERELEAYCVWFYNYANKHKESDERTSILDYLGKDFPYLKPPIKPSSEGEQG